MLLFRSTPKKCKRREGSPGVRIHAQWPWGDGWKLRVRIQSSVDSPSNPCTNMILGHSLHLSQPQVLSHKLWIIGVSGHHVILVHTRSQCQEHEEQDICVRCLERLWHLEGCRALVWQPRMPIVSAVPRVTREGDKDGCLGVAKSSRNAWSHCYQAEGAGAASLFSRSL